MADQHAIDQLYLDIDVKSNANNAQKVEKLAQALDKLEGVLYDFPSTTFDKVSSDLEKFGGAFNSLTSGNKQLSGLTTRLGNLNKKIESLDVSVMKRKFDQMATAVTPFIDKVASAQDSLTALNGVIGGANKINTPKAPKTPKISKQTKGFNIGLPKIFKVTALLHTFRRLGNIMGDIVTKGADFGETLNLWQVSMGDKFLPQATEFVDKLNEAYGISKKTLMNSQAIFKNMLGSLGEISDQTAYQLSEGITQMALDYASLYNVQFEDAMTKFQAALAGQVRPIRSVAGYDITENTLFQLYQSLGGTKTMRQLSRTEKQLLSIYAVFNQMERSGATGDLSRTMERFANQSRVMKDAWNDIQTYAGLTVTRLLDNSSIMQKLNATLIFTSRVLESLSGTVKNEETKKDDIFGDITDSANIAIESTEKLKSSLLDFDKFRALNPSDSESSLGIDDKLINAIKKYDSITADFQLESGKLADEWLEKFGGIETITQNIKTFFKDIEDSETWALFKTLNDTFSTIWKILGDDILPLWTSFWNLIDKEAMGSINGILVDLQPEIEDISKALEKIVQWLTNLFNTLSKRPSWWERQKTKVNTTIQNQYASGSLANNDKKWWEKLLNFFSSIKHPMAEYSFYADGGVPDTGSFFFAGESGAELVGNMSNGQTGVMNMQQLEDAVARGMLIGLSSVDFRDDRPIYVSLDGQRFFTISRDIFKRNGYDLSPI